MIRRLLTFLFGWLFPPSLMVLEKHASEYGTLLLQQVEGPTALYWQATLRARQDGGRPKYAWTATGDTIAHAIANVIDEALEHKIGAKPVLPFAPKLGGKQFDE